MSYEQLVVTPGGPAVDAHNPWPGLAAFTEDLAAYFCGRTEEAEDLFRRVKRKLLTTLFSMSGLGKTSLLQAGLFPILRRERYWPVPIRLDYQPEAPAFSDQVKAALAKALEDADLARAVSPDNGETLWEFLHHRDLEWKNTIGNILIPVLVFDQFEEMFTLGAAPAVRAERLPFLQELADLIENRPPASLEGKLEEEPERIETILFGKQDYRILLSLREDYLPQLEGLKPLAPSIMENRQRLRQMTGTQALEVLLKPGAGLVSPEVARHIVGVVANAGGTGKTLAVDELGELEVPPPILSLFARQLNDRRRQRGLAEITSALLSESAEGILEGFYEECLADQPPGVRAFVEEDLLTESGFRESIAMERAWKKLQDRGVAATALDELVHHRLLQVEERFGVQRIELTHDVLTEAIAKSRTERRQREALAAAAEREAALRESLRRQRRRTLAGTLAAVAVSMLAMLAVYEWVERRDAARQRDRAVQQKALALEAIKKLTYDLPDRLEKVPGVLPILKDVYENNLKLLDRVLELEGDSPEAMRERSANYNGIGHTWERLGDSAKAREAYDKARSIIERLVAHDPRNRRWQDDLAVSHVNIGDMLVKQGGQAKALEEYREALSIRERLAAQDSDNVEWQQKLAGVHSRLATQLATQGDVAAARKEQTAALEIAQRLAAKDRDNTDWQALLASTHTQLAQLTMIQGDVTAGIREQRAALEVFERLAAKEPGDTHWQEMLASGHLGLGTLSNLKGDPENGAKENGMAVEIYERLAAQDLDNAQWQNGLAMSHFVTGNALIDNDATRGISELRSALTLFEGLVAKDPSNAELQNYIALCHVRIANGLFAQKQFPEALAEARAAVAAAERMGAQDPKNAFMVQNPLAFAHHLIGMILKEQGDHGQAMKELMASLEIFRRLADQDPSNAMFQFQVANGGSLLARALLDQKKYDEACRAFGNPRDVLEPLVVKFPDNLFYKNSLANIYGGSSWACLLAQRPDEAIGAASKGLELDPTRVGAKMNLAHGYLLTNQFEKAKAIYLENKDVKLPDGRGFAQVVLKDFKDLREAGVSHPDLNAIERLLTGKPSAKRRN